jgi:hypothetical protein
MARVGFRSAIRVLDRQKMIYSGVSTLAVQQIGRVKIKIKLLLCLTNYAMKEYRGVDV